jgi:SpoIID/LytB domain protein
LWGSWDAWCDGDVRGPRLVVLAVLAAVAAPSPTLAAGPAAGSSAARTDRWDVSGRASIRVVGHGYGHGHGMSQYGAEGAARAGLDAQQILDFYYPGTDTGRAVGRISVLISADTTDDLVVRPTAGLRVRDLATGEVTDLPGRVDGAEVGRWRVRQDHRGLARVAWLPAGAAHDGGWRALRTLQGEGELDARGAPVTLVLPDGTERAYRGRLRAAAPSPGSSARDTVNRLRLEDYLRGVVPLEMPALWSPAAVQAQAVAARTYAAYERAHPRARHYQVCDTTSCQVYGGVAAEHPASDAAIEATHGRARTVDGAPAFTQFSSSNGGWSAAGSVDYLVAQEDPYDGFDGNPVHDWSVAVTDDRIESAWPAVGDLRTVEVLSRDGNGQWGGRVVSLRLAGSRGSVTVSGDAFRSALGLRSTWLTIKNG